MGGKHLVSKARNYFAGVQYFKEKILKKKLPGPLSNALEVIGDRSDGEGTVNELDAVLEEQTERLEIKDDFLSEGRLFDIIINIQGQMGNRPL